MGVRRFFRGLAQGLAEMKKTDPKRMSGLYTGTGSAVLDAPKSGYAPEIDRGNVENTGGRGSWQGRGPAPAGALQRGYGYSGDEGSDEAGGSESGYGDSDEQEYIPRRGGMQAKWRGIPKNLAGRIVLGVVTVGVLAAVAVVVAAGRRYLLHDPRFVLATTDEIQLEGAEHLTRDHVLHVFGSDL